MAQSLRNPPSLLDFIDTSRCRWLARGQLRDIYQHPDFPDALLKVIRTDRTNEQGRVISWARHKFFAQRQFGIYLTFLRELRETFRTTRLMHASRDTPMPFARALGLARTERGLGLIVEKATAPDGSLAPSVKRLLKDGHFTPLHRERLDRFFDFCAEHHFVFGDLNSGNLVFVDDAAGGRILCIDGIGEKTLIPVHEMSRFLNARKLRRMQRRIHAAIRKSLPQASIPAASRLPTPALSTFE